MTNGPWRLGASRHRLTRALACTAALVAAAPAAAHATAIHRTVRPGATTTVALQPHVWLVIPRGTVSGRGVASVERLPGHVINVSMTVPWHGRLRLVTKRHGHKRSVPFGGLVFPGGAAGTSAPEGASLRAFNPLKTACGKVAIAVGSAAIESGPFDPEIDGATVVACLAGQGVKFLGKQVASRIASALGHDCAAEVIKHASATGAISASVFGVPQCNESKGPSGGRPTNGTPLVIATLNDTHSPGIPLGNSSPSKPGSSPAPAGNAPSPSPAPSGGGLRAGQFRVMNASGGIYWRSSPDWNTPVSSAGNGFYPDTIIQVSCYQAGAANAPGTTDGMWEQASWAGGSGHGSGWINEHFIDDGAALNQPSPGVPACQTAGPAPAPTPAPATWTETAGGDAHTWTNYSNAGGYQGPTVAGGQSIQIACKVTGFKVADGNTWWYRIASSPWNNTYYVSADAFYNNGSTSGSLHGTPFVDSAVANC